MNRIYILAILSTLLITSCGKTHYTEPDLGGLYNRAAARSHMEGNPVIVIPGILGSKLRDSESGQLVWGAFEKTTTNPETPEGARLIALPMRKGAPISELTDNVHSDGALDIVKVSLFGLPLELNAYVNILSTLGAGGYLDEQLALNDVNQIDYGGDHFTCFQFAYDWRLDNVENARRLEEFIKEKKAYILEEYRKRGIERDEVKFDIVAHSMGGLLTRYFLRYGGEDLPADGSLPELTWAGAEYVDKAIIIGTPNAGAVGSIDTLVKGRDIGPFLPKYEPAIIGTFPSLYQQMPRTRHGAIRDESRVTIDVTKPETWELYGWGLMDPEQDKVLEWLLPDVSDQAERRAIALDHLTKALERGVQLQEALDVPAAPPPGLMLFLIAGDAIPTNAGLTVSETGEIAVTNYTPGDGTVTRASALMDERVGGQWSLHLVSPVKWSNVMFLFTDHLGLTMDPAFSDNVLFLLLEHPGI